MKIADGALVTLDVALYDAQGNLLEKSDGPLVYLHGHEDIFPRIETALEGLEPGARAELQLEPEEAFGDYDPEMVMLAPITDLGEGVQVGMRVEAMGAHGEDRCLFTITEIAEGTAVLDANHPLAGMAVRFILVVKDVRAATDEEIEEAESPLVPDFLRPPEPPTVH